MNLTNMPPLTSVPFASGASGTYRNTIPVASQIPTTPGAASYTDGFPPVTFQPIASGGVPPFGADVNGILYAQSVALQWEQAGGNYPFDATFATAIGGYPKDAIVMRADGKGQWLNTVDANTTDPDSTSASGWIALRANNGTVTIAVTAGSNTPTLNQLGAQVIVLTGAPSSAANLILPLTAGAQWLVRNATSGAGAVNVQGATGAVVTIPQGVGYLVYTDGAGYYASSSDVSGLYLPINGTAVAATKLASARAFNLAGVVTAAGVSFDGTGNVTLNTAIADGALSIAKTSGLQTALDAKANLSGAAFSGGISATIGLGTAASFTTSGSISGVVITDAGANGANLKLMGDGATSPNKTIRVNTGVLQFVNSAYSAVVSSMTDAGSWTMSGSVTATGGFQSSDRRLKENITPRAVQRGFALKVARMFCEWDRIADGVHDVGLVAQRVKTLASRYVTRGDKQGRRAGMLAIDKAGIALEASMDCALQLAEQDKTIKTLMRRIEKLEKAR